MILSINDKIKREHSLDGGLAGGFFCFSDSKIVYGISCNHVIADVSQCNVGDVITDANENKIGTLSHWLQLETKIINGAEFALFKLDESIETVWSKKNKSFKPAGFATPKVNSKIDFVTDAGSKQGIVSSTRHHVAFDWRMQEYHFNCVEITSMPGEKFSARGHSGGAVYSGDLLLGIILGISEDETKTYVVPFVRGILRFVNLIII